MGGGGIAKGGGMSWGGEGKWPENRQGRLRTGERTIQLLHPPTFFGMPTDRLLSPTCFPLHPPSEKEGAVLSIDGKTPEQQIPNDALNQLNCIVVVIIKFHHVK